MSLKNPVTTPGIDPGTVLLVVQPLSHYTTPGPLHVKYLLLLSCVNDKLISGHIFEIPSNIKFCEYPISGNRTVTCEQSQGKT